jgi:excinuclease UvrABC nuclease subunit
MSNGVRWTSKTGVAFQFHVLEYSADWKDVGGIYMFCGRNANGTWIPHYIGKCESFKSRLSGHDKWEPAQRAGATHVLATMIGTDASRTQLEELLIRELQPQLNTLLRGPSLADMLVLRRI